jgi:polygalacturonase
MDQVRRELLKLGGKAAVATIGCAMVSRSAGAATAPILAASTVFDVRSFGAVGDGKTIDSTAINRAIEAASATGGTVFFPAGLYACYSLRLRSAISLYLDQGSVIIAADTPREEVAACLVHGLTNKETARELKMSPRTVALVRLVYQLGGDNVGSRLAV